MFPPFHRIRICSLGTYFFVDQETKQAVPITQFVDAPGMLQDMEELSRKTTKLQFQLYSGLKVWNTLQRHSHEDRAPRGLTFKKYLQTLQGLTDKKLGRDGMDGTFTYRTLLVAGMHFQDACNYDIRTREASRDSLRHARRQAVSVLHVQLGSLLPRKDRPTVLNSMGPEDNSNRSRSKRRKLKEARKAPRILRLKSSSMAISPSDSRICLCGSNSADN